MRKWEERVGYQESDDREENRERVTISNNDDANIYKKNGE